MKMTIKNPALPVGKYEGLVFVGCEAIKTEFGPRMQTIFEDRESGKRTSSFSTTTPTLRNKCGQTLAALAGVEVADGVVIDPDDFIGQLYDVEVVESEGGKGTVVASFKRSEDSPF